MRNLRIEKARINSVTVTEVTAYKLVGNRLYAIDETGKEKSIPVSSTTPINNKAQYSAISRMMGVGLFDSGYMAVYPLPGVVVTLKDYLESELFDEQQKCEAVRLAFETHKHRMESIPLDWM